MDRPTRFEITLPADRRQALNELAAEIGLSASDLARLAINRLLSEHGDMLRGFKIQRQGKPCLRDATPL